MEPLFEEYAGSLSPKCLLVGNGINRCFDDSSWEKLIKEALKKVKDCKYEDIRDMPATMQIVVATGDHVNTQMKELSDTLINIRMTDERKQFYQALLDLPVETILTTNYGFELEITDGMAPRKSLYSHRLQSDIVLENMDRKYRLYQYYKLSNHKRIWHIHGDIAKPDTMLMGHYFYAKQLRAIQDCAAKTVRRYEYCKRNQKPFMPYSWVDQFLTGDVYILGFGMNFCESDLWYLASCKKKNFPESRTFFYEINAKISKHKMLETYNIKIIDGIILGETTSHKHFYDLAIQHIKESILK